MENSFRRAQLSPMRRNALEAILAPEMRPDRVGPRVTAMRETLRLSKAELADSIDLDRSSLTKIESGRMGLDLVKATRIADLYGFGLNYFYRADLSDVPLDLRSRLLNELLIANALPTAEKT